MCTGFDADAGRRGGCIDEERGETLHKDRASCSSGQTEARALMLRSLALPRVLTPTPTAARGQSKNASRDPKRQCKGDRARPLLVLTRKDPFFEVTLLNSVPRKITLQ